MVAEVSDLKDVGEFADAVVSIGMEAKTDFITEAVEELEVEDVAWPTLVVADTWWVANVVKWLLTPKNEVSEVEADDAIPVIDSIGAVVEFG